MHRRYRVRANYRRNPGGMLIDLAKQAVPVLIGLYGTRFLVSQIGPMLPLTSLGTFASPALAVGSVLLMNIATKKVGALAKHRDALMLGAGLAAPGFRNGLPAVGSTARRSSGPGIVRASALTSLRRS